MSLKTVEISIKGIRPMLMNNGHMADPENPIVIAINKLRMTSQKKRTDAQTAEISRLEWLGRLWWCEEFGMSIPSNNLEACLVGGAKKQKKGKDFTAAVFVDQESMSSMVQVHHAHEGKTREELYAMPDYVFRNLIKGSKGQRSVCIRPIIPTGWTVIVRFSFDDQTIANCEVIIDAFSDAGRLGGLGDWRPKFGRFVLEGWKEIKA